MKRTLPSLVVVAALAGCGASHYEQVNRAWTRHDQVVRGIDTVIDAHATLKSNQWREAYVDEKARRAKLSAADRAALEASERQTAAEFWEIQLVVATHDYGVMDFSSNETSMWRMTLIGDDGRAVTPTYVKQDRRTRPEIVSWHPELGPFHKAYVMRFPAKTADGSPLVSSGGKLALRMGSALGEIEVSWAVR